MILNVFPCLLAYLSFFSTAGFSADIASTFVYKVFLGKSDAISDTAQERAELTFFRVENGRGHFIPSPNNRPESIIDHLSSSDQYFSRIVKQVEDGALFEIREAIYHPASLTAISFEGFPKPFPMSEISSSVRLAITESFPETIKGTVVLKTMDVSTKLPVEHPFDIDLRENNHSQNPTDWLNTPDAQPYLFFDEEREEIVRMVAVGKDSPKGSLVFVRYSELNQLAAGDYNTIRIYYGIQNLVSQTNNWDYVRKNYNLVDGADTSFFKMMDQAPNKPLSVHTVRTKTSNLAALREVQKLLLKQGKIAPLGFWSLLNFCLNWFKS